MAGDEAMAAEMGGASNAALAHDLFLSYHRPDRETVEGVRRLLEARGIATFLDRSQLVAGLPWGRALEEALRGVRGVAVFLGPDGLGTWQSREMWFALDRQAQEEAAGRAFPVVPVLLPDVRPSDLTSGFLFQNTWVDLRADLTDPEALDALARAIHREDATEAQAGRIALCPYLGLGAFREQDAAFFFGREEFAERLGEAVFAWNLVAVVGPSGSGKSSAVQAGLLPRLRRRRPPHDTWDAVTFTPGDRPFHRLAAQVIPLIESALSETDRLTEAKKLGDRLAVGDALLEDVIARVIDKSDGTDRLLLVVDQFEEVFTLTPEESRAPFVAALLAVIDRAPVTLVLTLRADFYGHAISLSHELSDRLEHGVVNLGSMRPDELERSVIEPARRVGVGFEPGLVRRILNDVTGEPGNLPLLEFALTELWAHAPGGPLTHRAYEEIGSVAGAIARRAEIEYTRLPPDQQAATGRLFARLVRVARPEEDAEDTRQRTALDTIAAGEHGARVRAIIHALAGARLLVTGRDPTTGDETVEVGHEALIRHWGRLRQWLREDRDFLVWRQDLEQRARVWAEVAGRDLRPRVPWWIYWDPGWGWIWWDPGALLRPKRRIDSLAGILTEEEGRLLRGRDLREAEAWSRERSADLSEPERRFIAASRALQKREQRRVWFGLGYILAALFGTVAGLALWGVLFTVTWSSHQDSLADLVIRLQRVGDAQEATGDLGGALASYRLALVIRERQSIQTYLPSVTAEPNLVEYYNWVCWHGALAGVASQVLPDCDRAVTLADESIARNHRDSRGLARALTGDLNGALEDFGTFVEWAQGRADHEPLVARRRAWILALEAGRDPFDAATLAALRDE